MGMGESTRRLLITRALAEMTHFARQITLGSTP
jgi:glycerol-3-phosphate dehydrogenase